MKNIVLDGHKLYWHSDRVKAWLNNERIAPITIDCSLTRACTYNCIYCYGKLQANENRQISRDAFFRFLDDAAEIGVKAISFVSDGESTCSPFLYDAIVKAKQLGLDVALGTNGYLLADDKLITILPALTYLRFNISAAQPDRYSEIHGCSEQAFYKVINTIKKSVEIKHKYNLQVTLGLQMVLMPQFQDQVIPLAILGKELGVDYLVIKHCSDDEQGSLGIDYDAYLALKDLLKKAEQLSTETYLVQAKWSKIMSRGKRTYSQCYGPPFLLQISGSGLVAPCGMLFNSRFKEYHIGNINDTSFKKIWESKKYWDVMNTLASTKFNAHTMCGTLCLQHKVNEYLDAIKKGQIKYTPAEAPPPQHINFI